MNTGRVARRSIAGIVTLVGVAAYGQMNRACARDGLKAESVADATGNLHVPRDYRTAYQLLGSWAVAAEGQGSKELPDR